MAMKGSVDVQPGLAVVASILSGFSSIAEDCLDPSFARDGLL